MRVFVTVSTVVALGLSVGAALGTPIERKQWEPEHSDAKHFWRHHHQSRRHQRRAVLLTESGGPASRADGRVAQRGQRHSSRRLE